MNTYDDLNKEDKFEEDDSIRPKYFKDLIGREREVKSLNILISAAKQRGESIDHILFHGPPGLGKTSLAHIIANEVGVSIRVTSGPAIERAGDLAAILTNLEHGDILFIDEIHRLNKLVEEVLYPAMEDYSLDIIVGKGPSARTLRIDLPPFTVIGATTRMSLLSSPLRDRFGVIHRLDYYNTNDLVAIVKRASKILKINIDELAAKEVALRSRGTARIANRLLKRIRDFSQVNNSKTISHQHAKDALSIYEIDDKGLDEIDRKILLSIIEKYSGGPVGINTLAASISEDIATLEEIYEPYLIKIGFLQRTPRGRIVTKEGYKHLDKEYIEQK